MNHEWRLTDGEDRTVNHQRVRRIRGYSDVSCEIPVFVFASVDLCVDELKNDLRKEEDEPQ